MEMNRTTNISMIICFLAITLACLNSVMIEPKDAAMHANRRMDILVTKTEETKKATNLSILEIIQRLGIIEKRLNDNCQPILQPRKTISNMPTVRERI